MPIQILKISEFLQTFTGQNYWGKVFLQSKYLQQCIYKLDHRDHR